ncbi:BatD family protein [Frigoriflavimonas asaccharolytica]|uniref:Oxygen tolerance protein BatD n=1 Tax=Frigoriflavimonas asaccharolytica TaxID=2735899 RepID=A0A8J8KBS5_9FLAO|nr:BatD family protein [Frigoriflavimonas asaccharolytica]NRS92869.1 hypothetical protein [Frigoriflavimonas asaccharolytica]
MNKIQYIFFLLATVFCYGQITFVPLIEDKVYKVNQKFLLTFILEVNSEHFGDQSSIKLPDFSKFERLGSGSEKNTLILENLAVNQIIFQQVLSPKISGKVKIGSALITVNGKIYKTEPFDIMVEEADKVATINTPTKIKNDLYLNLEIADKEVYQNQPTVAVLKAYSSNINNFRKVNNVRLPMQDNVEFSTIKTQKSDIDLNKAALSSQILAVFLVFPEESGSVKVESASASFSKIAKKILSNGVKLNVKNLPVNAPKDFKNAVGDFKIDFAKNNEDKIEINKPINVRLTISGKGNFNNIQLPIIKDSELYEVFQPRVRKDIHANEKGVNGKIVADYIIIPKKTGPLSILTESFSYFNPEEKKYIDLGSQSIDLDVRSQKEILAERTPLEIVNAYSNNVLETVDNPVLETKTLKLKQNSHINWYTSLLNFILFCAIIGLLLLINNFKKNKKKKTSKNVRINTFSAPITNIGISDSELQNAFGYLKRMLREKNYAEIFTTIKNIDLNFRNAYNTSVDDNFATILENAKGSKIAEEYRTLFQKIEMERFAPIKLEDQLEELVNSTIIFFTKIAK